LKISTPSGFSFAFTGGLETVPDTSGLTGTSIPRFSGEYKGTENGIFDVRFVGSGSIGQTPGLKAEVYDAGGRLVGELDIGEGYEAGTELDLLDGVSIAFETGTVVDGESASTPLIANSDSTGILSALGLNSFFSGDSATTIAINNEVLANPNRLAVSRTGEVSDASNLKRIIDLKDELIVDGKFGFDQFLGGLSSEIGASVKGAQALQDQFQQLQFQFESARDAASGVDINEEMVNLSRYQRAYEASLRVISTIDQMYQDVLQILR
jgi:flagellar hook-associated protein FlgK